MDKKRLLKKLSAYSAATGAALAVGTPADAQIQYSGYVDTTLNFGQNYSIDFDGDMTNEAYIYVGGNYMASSSSGVFASNPGYASFIGAIPSVSPLAYGASIGSAASWAHMSSQEWLKRIARSFYTTYISSSSFSTITNTFTYGSFSEGVEEYIGVKMDLGGSIHYGWIRVEIGPGCGSVRVVDWAYELTPDTPIMAGDKGDSTPPTVTCPGDQSQDASATCDAVLADYTGMTTITDDIDPAPVLVQSPAPGTVITGTTTVTMTGTDEAGNWADCTFDVTLNDVTIPIITSPGNQTVDANATCEASIPDYTGMPTVSDNCDPSPTVTQSPAPGTTISGITTVTLTATDAASNFMDCTFDVEVIDVTAPDVTPPADQFVTSDLSCEGVLTDYTGMATITDNCDASPIVTQDPIPGTTISTSTVVTIYAEDADGNIGSNTFNVDIMDVIIPDITCPGDQIIDMNGSCEAVMPDYTGLVIASDNCDSSLDFVQDPAPGTLLYAPPTVTITATDDGGNSDDCTFDASLNTELNDITLTSTNVSCFGENDGSATVTIDGCSPIFHIAWSNGETTETITDLAAGNYTVTVTDAGGNVLIDMITITQPAFINTTITVNSVPCGTSDGNASAAVSGGVSPYTYLWSNGDADDSATGLEAGMHSLMVTDDTGCNALYYFNIDNTGGPTLTLESTTDVSCNGYNDGVVDVSLTGGSPPYEIEWSTGETTEDISGLVAGTYDITITDGMECQLTDQFEILQPDELEATYTPVEPGCSMSDGSLTANITGGTPPYNVNWSSGSTTPLADNLPAGTYEVTITDDNGCQIIDLVPLVSASSPVITVDSLITVTCGDTDGEIYTTIDGGTPPYVINWDFGPTTDDITGLDVGTYEMVVEDAANCTGILNLDLDYTKPLEQPICMVRVDTTTGTNLVVWEKVEFVDIDYYNIYRETSVMNEFLWVASVPFDSVSVYTDPVAHPEHRSWRYKVSAVNVCGTESDLSDPHKTIHLTVNMGLGGAYNLIWDYYDGFEYFTYEIYRHTDVAGWELINSLPANMYTYSEIPPTEDGLNYVIAVERAEGDCLGTKDVGGPFSQSVSNLEDNVVATENEKIEEGDVNIYPNPATDVLNIKSDQVIDRIEINTIVGNTVANMDYRSQINIANLAPGVYFVKVFNEEGELMKVQKFVKE